MSRDRANFLFLNIGHFLDHLFVLIFATVAALRLTGEWGMSYAELIPYATPGFVAFGLCAVPAGWLADKWSREGMMVVFFIGIGVSSLLASLASTPLEIALGLLLIGVFAAIYHPVGLAMVVHGREKTGIPLAINGIFGNLGVASAALLTGLMIDTAGWRAAFVVPAVVSIGVGIAYWVFVHTGRTQRAAEASSGAAARKAAAGSLELDPATLKRVFVVVMFAAAVGGLIFQSTTFALPKILDERLRTIADSATSVGSYAFMVFALAAFAQLVVGYLVDRHSVRMVFAVVAGMQAVLFAVMHQLTGIAALAVSLCFMLAVFGQIPITDVLVGRITRSEWRSRVYSLKYIINFSVSASALPLIAWLHAGWGFGALFTVLAIAATCIFAAVLALPRGGEVVMGRAAAAG
jgi:MFS family permease